MEFNGAKYRRLMNYDHDEVSGHLVPSEVVTFCHTSGVFFPEVPIISS